jgi:hypothetical protein
MCIEEEEEGEEEEAEEEQEEGEDDDEEEVHRSLFSLLMPYGLNWSALFMQTIDFVTPFVVI